MGNKVNFTEREKKIIIDLYSSEKPRSLIQRELSEPFNVSERMIRNYAFELGLNVMQQNVANEKVLAYDIERLIIH